MHRGVHDLCLRVAFGWRPLGDNCLERLDGMGERGWWGWSRAKQFRRACQVFHNPKLISFVSIGLSAVLECTLLPKGLQKQSHNSFQYL